MRKIAAFVFVALVSVLSWTNSVSAQTCNDPSGFLKSFGQIPLGDTVVLGPDCQHLQDGGPIASTSFVFASAFGVKCDGVTDDAPSLRAAVKAALGAPVIIQAGTCILNSSVYLNKTSGPGILTTPGLKLIGQGRGVTLLDTRVSADWAIGVNPEWRAAFAGLAGASAGTSGNLATNTYNLQITMNDGVGNEIFVTLSKAFSVTGPTGSVSVTLPPIHSPYSYNIYIGTGTPGNYATLTGGTPATGLGGNQTVSVTGFSSAHTLPSAIQASWQEASVSNLSIVNSTSTANTSGLLFFKVGYSDVTDVYFKGLTGDGMNVPNYTGDIDGSFVITVDRSKFDNIAGWCLNAGGNVLELSNLTVSNSVFNLCGTLPTNFNSNFTVSSITNANPAVVTTSSPHTLATNDEVNFQNIGGMALANGFYRVTVTGSTTFTLQDLNGTAINTISSGAYTPNSATEALVFRPPTVGTGSGALSWTGLIGNFINNGFTQNKNVAMYFTEAGSSDNATINGTDFENTYGKGLYVAALIGGSLRNSECLTTGAVGPTFACVQIGTGFSGGGVSNFTIDTVKVRSDVSMNAFEQVLSTNQAGVFADQNTVKNIIWQAFDAATQNRFFGYRFPGIVGTAKFSVSALNTVQLSASGDGNSLPLHLKATGEWVELHAASAISLGSLSGTANTLYYFYAYNSAVTAAPWAGALEQSLTGPVLSPDGYLVKSGDSTRTLVGTAITDSGGNFQTTGNVFSQYPAGVAVPYCSNILGADVAMNVTANYFVGPSCAVQGLFTTNNTFEVNATVTVLDTSSVAAIICRLSDGVTVFGSSRATTTGAGNPTSFSLVGVWSTPASGFRVECRDSASVNGVIAFNNSGNGRDSQIAVKRLY